MDLQQVCDSSVVPATYSAVGHVQESPPMKVAGTYSAVIHSQETPFSGRRIASGASMLPGSPIHGTETPSLTKSFLTIST